MGLLATCDLCKVEPFRPLKERMERVVRGRRGRGRGAGRNPGPRMNTRARAGEQASSADSDTAHTAGETTLHALELELYENSGLLIKFVPFVLIIDMPN
ncbi:hypothetical protein OROMI_008270 [Orobanche minor]